VHVDALGSAESRRACLENCFRWMRLLTADWDRKHWFITSKLLGPLNPYLCLMGYSLRQSERKPYRLFFWPFESKQILDPSIFLSFGRIHGNASYSRHYLNTDLPGYLNPLHRWLHKSTDSRLSDSALNLDHSKHYFEYQN
jgi:hypothetical protein